MIVDPNFNPEIGFLPRQNFRRNYSSARFSPRPAHNTRSSDATSTRAATTTRPTTRIAWSRARRQARLPRSSSRTATCSASRDSGTTSCCASRCHSPRTCACRPAATASATCATAWAPGQQHRLSGIAAFDVGEFYDGTKKTASLNARFGFSTQLGVEPNISLNWIERQGTRGADPGDRRADDVHDDAADVRRSARAVRVQHQYAVDQLPVSLGISTRQRALRRLHRRARHARARDAVLTSEPRHRHQGESAFALLDAGSKRLLITKRQRTRRARFDSAHRERLP